VQPNMRHRARDWFAIGVKTAGDYTLSKEGAVVMSLLSSLLVSYWMIEGVGFMPKFIQSGLFHPLHHLVFHLLFLIPTSLAIALKSGISFLLVIPYLILLGFSLIQILLGIVSGAFLYGDILANYAIFFFVAAVAVPTVLATRFGNIDETKKKKVYQTLLLLQLTLAAGLAYYYTYHYGVWHLTEEPISVRRLRLGDGELSLPLIEGDDAYIVDRAGRLYQIDLALGRKRVLAQIPRPTAAEVGFPAQALPVVEHPAIPFRGMLTRVDDYELSFRYLHQLVGWGPIGAGVWTVEVRINQNTGHVSWRVEGREHEALVEFTRYNVTVAHGRTLSVHSLATGTRPFTVVISGEGIKTAIDPLGRETWEHANHGWLLVGTDRGGLIIATAKDR